MVYELRNSIVYTVPVGCHRINVAAKAALHLGELALGLGFGLRLGIGFGMGSGLGLELGIGSGLGLEFG